MGVAQDRRLRTNDLHKGILQAPAAPIRGASCYRSIPALAIASDPPLAPGARPTSRIILTTLGAVLLAAALFNGGADPWPRMLLQWLSLLLVGVALWEPGRGGLGTAEFLLLGGVLLLPLLYLVPVPASFQALLPGREVFDQALGLAAPEALVTARPLSLHPFVTESAWLTSLIAVGVYVATRALGERGGQHLTYLLFGVALAQVVIGLFQFATATTGVSYELAGLAPRGGAASGTYRNRNHLAGLLAMVFPLALALFIFHFGRGSTRNRRNRGWREKLIALLRAGGRPSLAFGLLGIFLVVGIVVTRSRSGIAMAMLGLMLVAALFARHVGGGASFGLMGRLVTLAIGFAAALGLAPVLDRFAWGDMEGDARWRIASASLDGAGSLLPLGSGLGTYPDAFPIHQPVELGRWFINHAHNDYLELLYETGVPGLVLMVLFLALFFRQWGRLMAGAEWSRFRFLQIGAGIGLTLLLGHSFTDYNLHVPANLATFAFLAGLFFSPPGRLPVTHGKHNRGRRTRSMREQPAVMAAGASTEGSVVGIASVGQGGESPPGTLEPMPVVETGEQDIASHSGGKQRPRNPFDVVEP